MKLEDVKVGMKVKAASYEPCTVEYIDKKKRRIGISYRNWGVAWFSPEKFTEIKNENKSEIKPAQQVIQTLAEDVQDELNKIAKLFKEKNDQYATTEDELSNFTIGAELQGLGNDEAGRYEALKGYMAKHIA